MNIGRISSGQYGDPEWVASYRSEWHSATLVERVVWGQRQPWRVNGQVLAAEGYTWVRFWLLPSQGDGLVEKLFEANGQLLGTLVNITMPIVRQGDQCYTDDLILRLWIAPDGRTTVIQEKEFERAVMAGVLSVGQAKRAEYHLRDLTAEIARGLFPPPWVQHYRV